MKNKKITLSEFDENLDDLFNANKKPSKDDYYYDAMELLGGGKKEIKEALRLFNLALEMDKNYVQTYIGLISAYGTMGNQKKFEEYLKIAYTKTLEKFPKWPERIEWGILENRAYMRAMQYMGDFYWDSRENEKAIEIFRLLLKLNPNDNQGVRFEISALCAGLTGKDINRMTDDGNKKQDWSEQDNLLKTQNKKHKFWKEPK